MTSNLRPLDQTSSEDPHAGQRLLLQGASLTTATAAVILLHGRGGAPEDMLSLADEWNVPAVAYLAPAAADRTWYPRSFLAPIEQNEPALSSALGVLQHLIESLSRQGIGRERIIIAGFSQGACLGLEYVARHARRYGGVVGLSGGLIGPQGAPREDHGSLERTPLFLGCSDVDPHIPVERVRESAEVFRGLGGLVDERIYPGMGHTINADEMHAIKSLLQGHVRSA
jgi:predicted esterase